MEKTEKRYKPLGAEEQATIMLMQAAGSCTLWNSLNRDFPLEISQGG